MYIRFYAYFTTMNIYTFAKLTRNGSPFLDDLSVQTQVLHVQRCIFCFNAQLE